MDNCTELVVHSSRKALLHCLGECEIPIGWINNASSICLCDCLSRWPYETNYSVFITMLFFILTLLLVLIPCNEHLRRRQFRRSPIITINHPSIGIGNKGSYDAILPSYQQAASFPPSYRP
jgi:hypothetical protein